MESTIPLYLTSLLRQVAAMIAGYLLAKGYITAEDVPAISGALLAVAAILWSLNSRRKSVKALNDAIAAPSGEAKP